MSLTTYPDSVLFPGPAVSDVAGTNRFTLEEVAQAGSLVITATAASPFAAWWYTRPLRIRSEYYRNETSFIRFTVTVTSGRGRYTWTLYQVDSTGAVKAQLGSVPFPSVTSSGTYSQNFTLQAPVDRFFRLDDRILLALEVQPPLFVSLNHTLSYGGVGVTGVLYLADFYRDFHFANRRGLDRAQPERRYV